MASTPDRFYPTGASGHPATHFGDAANDALRPTFGKPLTTDIKPDGRKTVVVIGGGYPGLSTALHLAEENRNMRVILLDAGHIGQGASGKSAGHVGGLQARDNDVLKHCGPKLGVSLLTAAAKGMDKVFYLIDVHHIPCDRRDGYVVIGKDGKQSLHTGGDFGITPYPFVLGLARAAYAAGVDFHEHSPVTAIQTNKNGAVVTTAQGSIVADYVVAAAGQKMAETIPALAHLRHQTTELRITTIITDPLPPAVIKNILPAANGERYPFANSDVDVAYGNIDKQGRLVFGAHATAFTNPDETKIRASLFKMFPTLQADYKRETGRDLTTRAFVSAEKLSYTADALPQVGQAGDGGRILYINALGGHGIGAGVMLGEAAADKVAGLLDKNPRRGHVFDQFASVKHMRLPTSEPFRALAAEAGIRLMRIKDWDGVVGTVKRGLRKLKPSTPSL